MQVEKKETYKATGRRKEASARVRLVSGEGKILINDHPLEKYFPLLRLQQEVTLPLVITDNLGRFNVFVNVCGGGISGQAGAVKMGIARALINLNENLKSTLRKEGLLTRDPREKERKKYGRKRARKRFQYSKR